MSTPATQSPSQPFLPGQSAPKKKGSPLRRYLVAGVLVWLPIVATIWVVSFLFTWWTGRCCSCRCRPATSPQGLMGFLLPGLGAVFVLVVLLLTGSWSPTSSAGGCSVWGRTCCTTFPSSAASTAA